MEEGSINNDLIYKLREFLNSRRRGGRLEYLVDWKGYEPEERSWVPSDDILDPVLMEEFHSAHPDHPALSLAQKGLNSLYIVSVDSKALSYLLFLSPLISSVFRLSPSVVSPGSSSGHHAVHCLWFLSPRLISANTISLFMFIDCIHLDNLHLHTQLLNSSAILIINCVYITSVSSFH